MDTETIVRIGREALLLTVLLAAPAVLAALVVGLLVSVLQAATQLHEQTLSFAPKFLAVFVTVAICGLWMLAQLSRFTTRLLEMIGTLHA